MNLARRYRRTLVCGTHSLITMNLSYAMIAIGISGCAPDPAPAWSTDGSTIAFESYAGDPDGSTGTKLLLIAAPMLSAVR